MIQHKGDSIRIISTFEECTNISLSIQNLIIARSIRADYAKLSHFENGPPEIHNTQMDSRFPNAHHFIFPTLNCDNRYGIIIEQDYGTLTEWFGHTFEHSSSVNEYHYDNDLQTHIHNDLTISISQSIGMVITQMTLGSA
jgi:hypothetical protein